MPTTKPDPAEGSMWGPKVWQAIEAYAHDMATIHTVVNRHGGPEDVPEDKKRELMEHAKANLDELRRLLQPTDYFPYAVADARRRRDYIDEEPIH